MVDKILTPFGENGALMDDAEFEGEASDGMTAERFRHDKFNKIELRQDLKINEAIEGTPKTISDDGNDQTFVTEVFSPAVSIMNPEDTSNIIDTGATRDVFDIVNAVIDKSKKLITIEDGDIYVYDVTTRAFEIKLDTELLAGLDTTGTQSWNPLSCCADATNLYVLFVEDDASPNEYWIQSYRLSDWAVNSAWPTYGTQMSVWQLSVGAREAQIRNATPGVTGKLVVSQTWRVVSSGTNDGLSIIDKTDGTVDGGGCGDVGSTSVGQVIGICSNGTYIFAALKTTGDLKVASMSIASPGATGGGSFQDAGTLPAVAGTYFTGIACCGNNVVVTYNNGTVLFAVLNLNQGVKATFSTGDADVIERLQGVVTNGMAFWAQGSRNVEGYAASVEDVIYRLDGATFGGYSFSADGSTEDFTDGENYVTGFRTGERFSNEEDPDDEKNLMVFDGDDIWIPFKPDSGNTIIKRFAKTILR